ANVKGMVASARAIVSTVVFILVSPAGIYRPLTIPSCGLPRGNSIACISYKPHPIHRGDGEDFLAFPLRSEPLACRSNGPKKQKPRRRLLSEGRGGAFSPKKGRIFTWPARAKRPASSRPW